MSDQAKGAAKKERISFAAAKKKLARSAAAGLARSLFDAAQDLRVGQNEIEHSSRVEISTLINESIARLANIQSQAVNIGRGDPLAFDALSAAIVAEELLEDARLPLTDRYSTIEEVQAVALQGFTEANAVAGGRLMMIGGRLRATLRLEGTKLKGKPEAHWWGPSRAARELNNRIDRATVYREAQKPENSIRHGVDDDGLKVEPESFKAWAATYQPKRRRPLPSPPSDEQRKYNPGGHLRR